MTALIAELVELARGDLAPADPEDVRLDLVTADAIERTTRNRPGVSFKPELEESMIRGVPATIERAVSNLLDNAAKWSPPDGEIEVTVRDGELTVRDHGPGIDEEDLPYVFDRFYRAPPRPRHARLGARPRDRPPGRGGPRRQRHGRAAPTAAGHALDATAMTLLTSRLSLSLPLRSSLVSYESVFYLRVSPRELLRRRGRTILTMLGLAVGVGLVIAISASRRARRRAGRRRSTRSPRIGTDLTVTRTAQQDTGGGGPFGGGGGPATSSRRTRP